MVNFLSSFLKDLRRTLIPIYELQKKNKKFTWTKEAQTAFDTIKEQLLEPPILHTPRSDGLYRLESDTSREGVGGTLFQKQDNQWVLIGYHSKKLPTAIQNYGVTELELIGLLVNIHGFLQLLHHRYFEILVDHKAIEHLKKGKDLPSTTRLCTLLMKLKDFTIDLKYQVGREMFTSDALSRLHSLHNAKSNSDVIPLNFLQHFSEAHIYHQYTHDAAELYAHNKARIKPPSKPRGRPRKSVIPDIKPPKNTKKCQKNQEKETYEKTGMAKTTKDIKNNMPQPVRSLLPSDSKIKEIITRAQKTYDRLQLAQGTQQQLVTTNALTPYVVDKTNKDVETAVTASQLAPDKIITTTCPVDKTYYDKTVALFPNNTSTSILRKHIPRQAEIDAILKGINYRVLHRLQLPLAAIELARAYYTSPRFKDIYLYIKDGKLPNSQTAQRCIRADALNYVVVNDLLYHIDYRKDKQLSDEKLLLVIPEQYEPIIFNMYHDSLLA